MKGSSRSKDAHDGSSAQDLPARAVVEPLVRWYRAVRRDLPWRKAGSAYAVWLSEIMLQQTRVETVIPYYERFLARFPTVLALAEAPLEHVLTEWSGLGYYRRARMLHAAAQRVVADHGGEFPRTAEGLRTLPGVGRYTAGAIASIAWGERAALVDGNVARVLARVYAIERDPTRGPGHAEVWRIAESLVPRDAPGDFNQALMELGATVCVPRAPRCDACPLAPVCRAHAQSREEELPRIAKKTPPEAHALRALVARAPGGVVLARRAEGGLFAGLWEPPSVPFAADARAAFRALVGVVPRTLTPRGEVTHVLTHRRLEVTVVEGKLTAREAARIALGPSRTYDALRVVGDRALASLPTSTLMRRILAAAQSE